MNNWKEHIHNDTSKNELQRKISLKKSLTVDASKNFSSAQEAPLITFVGEELGAGGAVVVAPSWSNVGGRIFELGVYETHLAQITWRERER